MSIGSALREMFYSLIKRTFSVQAFLFPGSINWFITKSDREIKANAKNVRGVFGRLV
jgi:hypothetical protein